MNLWQAATFVLLLLVAPPALIVVRRGALDALIAMSVSGTLTTLALLTLAAASGRPLYADIALAIGLLSFGSSIAYAHFLERWL